MAIYTKGSRLADFSGPATTKGYLALEDWAGKPSPNPKGKQGQSK